MYGTVQIYDRFGRIERQWDITGAQLRRHLESVNEPPAGCSRYDWEQGQLRAKCFGRIGSRRSGFIRTAVAVDAATSATSVTSASTLSYSHTCSGSNRALYVDAGLEWFGTSLSSITYAGSPLTALWGTLTSSTFYNSAARYMVAPATGANNVVLTMSGTADRLTSGVISLTGVDQSTPVGTPVTATGTAADPSVTLSSAATDLMVCSMGVNYNDQMVNGAGQTEWTRSGPAGTISCIATKAGTGSNVTFTWNHGVGSSNFCIGAVAFKQVSASSIIVNPMNGRGGSAAQPVIAGLAAIAISMEAARSINNRRDFLKCLGAAAAAKVIV